MSQNDSAPLCQIPDWFWSLGDQIQWFSCYIVLPIYVLVGLSGHTICWRAFVKQVKSEKAYTYQIYLTVAGTVDVLFFTFFMIGHQGSGQHTMAEGGIDGWPSFQKTYTLMFFAAHLGIPLCNGSSVLRLFLSTSMAADRVFAFVKPFIYKNIQHKKHQLMALVISILIGYSITFYNVFLFNVVPFNNSYLLSPNIEYLETTLALALAYTCNITRVVGLCALIVCNVTLIKLYKRRSATVIHANKDVQRETKKKEGEKMLIRLTLFQSLFTGISMLTYVIFYTGAYTVANFNICEAYLFAPLMDTVLMLCDIADTCTVILVNKKTRKILIDFFQYFKEWKLVTVEKTGTVPTGSTNGPTVMGLSGHNLVTVNY